MLCAYSTLYLKARLRFTFTRDPRAEAVNSLQVMGRGDGLRHGVVLNRYLIEIIGL